jgi:hypothetical protein
MAPSSASCLFLTRSGIEDASMQLGVRRGVTRGRLRVRSSEPVHHPELTKSIPQNDR